MELPCRGGTEGKVPASLGHRELKLKQKIGILNGWMEMGDSKQEEMHRDVYQVLKTTV